MESRSVFRITSPSCSAGCLPANAVIVAIVAPVVADADEIDDRLSIAQFAGNLSEVRIVIADNNCLRMVENGVDVINHEARYMRDPVQDKIAIGTYQARHSDIIIVDSQVIALSQKALD